MTLTRDHYEDLVPDASLLSTGYSVEFGFGASDPGSLHAALADELPSTTFIGGSTPWTRAFDASAVLGGDYRCSFTTYTLQSYERCRRVRVHCIANGRAAQYMFGLGNGAVTDERLGRVELYPLPGGADLNQWIVGPWAPKAQDSSGNPTLEWGQTQINDLRARITPTAAHFLGTGYFYKLRMQLDIVAKPVPSFIEPSAEQVFATPDPTIRWTVDTSTAQKKVEMKIFPAALVEDASFNILTSTAAVYTFKGTTSARSHKVALKPSGGYFLDRGIRYFAFIRTAIDFNGEDWWSDWSAGVAFKINAKPTVTVLGPLTPVVDSAKPIVTWDYEDEEGNLQSGARIIILQKTTPTWPGLIDPEAESLAGNAIYDSGMLSTEDLDHELPVALENGKQFRAYVQVRQRVPSVLDSDWAYITFDTSFAAPLTPTLAAVDAGTSVDLRVVPALSNLLDADSSSFETATGQWVAGTSTSISRVTSQFLFGAASLQVQRTGTTGTAQAFSDNLVDPCIPVVVGQTVSVTAWVKAGTTARSCQVGIELVDASNAVVDTTLGVASSDSTTQWTKRFASVVVPAGSTAIKGRVRLDFSSCAAGENHFVDGVMFYSGSASDEIPFDLGGGTAMVTLSPDQSARTKIRNWLTRNQSSLETDTTGWAAWTANTTITRSLTQAWDGVASLRLERTSTTGDAQAVTPVYPNAMKCEYGDELTFIARFRAGTTGRTVFTNFVFYDSGGNTLPTPAYLDSNFATDATNWNTIIKIRTVAPINAKSFAVTVTAQNIPTAEFHYVDGMIVYRGDTDVWSLGDCKSLGFVDCQLIIGVILLDWLPEDEVVLWDIWDYERNQECSARLWLQTDGKLRWEWSTNGTEGLKKVAVSTAAIPAWAGSSLNFIKVQFDNDNGASGQNTKFFYGASETTATTQIGATVTVATVEAPYQGQGVMHFSGQGSVDGGWQGYAYFVELRDDQTGAGNVLAKTYFQFPNVTEWRDQGNFGGRLWELSGVEEGMHAEMEIREEPNPDYYEIMRSRDGGVTWEYFRYDMGLLSNRVPKAQEPFVITDHEVPLKKQILYRIASGYVGLGYDVNSPWSANAAATVLGSYVTLKCTMDPSLSHSFPVADDWLEMKQTKARTFFQPIGRRNPVVIKGLAGAVAFSIRFTIVGQEMMDAMEALMNMPHTMIFVQTPKGSWWTEIATDTSFSGFLWDSRRGLEDVYTIEIPFQEVDRLEVITNVASHA